MPALQTLGGEQFIYYRFACEQSEQKQIAIPLKVGG